MAKINIGVVGYGFIGKRHAQIARDFSAFNLTGVVEIKDLNPQAGLFNTIQEMLDNTQTDIVSICTPNYLHADQALICLENNKHVIIEKPMALKTSDCEKIIAKSLQVHKHVFCVMQNRYSPPSVWLKSIQKLLGKIYFVQVNCFWNRDERYYNGGWHGTEQDGGTLFTQFSHFIDILYWVFGDIKNIRTSFADFNHKDLTCFEDSGIVQFDLSEGMGVLNYSTSCYDKNLESSLTVIAENGSLKIGGQYMNKVEYCHIKGYEMPELAFCNPSNNYGTHEGSANNHAYVFQNVVDTLRNNGNATTNAMEGFKVVDIIERIYAQK